jgi:hypothetical protein
MDFLVGGVYGDMKEAGNSAMACVCCLLCVGPILIILGVATFISSFTDTRLHEIADYNHQVDVWNDFGPSFAGQSFYVSTGKEKALLGQVAPEFVGDKSLRVEEVFTPVQNPWYYALKDEDRTSIFGHDVDSHGVERTTKSLTVSNPNGQMQVLTFPLIQTQTVEYNWHVHSYSSEGSGSITCRNPSHIYPGSRFDAVESCDTWCRFHIKGVWSSTFAAGGDCYRTSTGSTGCCKAFYGLDHICLRVKEEKDAGYQIIKDGKATDSESGGNKVSASEDEGKTAHAPGHARILSMLSYSFSVW